MHTCRLGSRLDTRVIGALVIYVGMEDSVTVEIDGEGSVTGRVVTVPAFVRHRIAAGPKFVKTILIEPETVSERCLSDLRQSLNMLRAPDPKLDRLLSDFGVEGVTELSPEEPFDCDAFDTSMFGYALEKRTLDERIHFATRMVMRGVGDAIFVADCADEFSMSSSRFRRLFVNDTGIQFRRYRMWRRARAYLEHIDAPNSLTETAMTLGYPDSTHFSRSIRSTYGLPPKQMRASMLGSDFIVSQREPEIKQMPM
ncbi:helix-turn-helix domain-containing protein [Salipiger abyssi]|uniref:helix-turn-helix domain-containing protein n=1 Tax=Salipiger abyssi TaxID=1250539 RepID=UPI001A8E926C|nr:helix-turn-helix domain-containing protein [Salipiger abyssi]MBN9887169.1 helix-turn-helix domain-containing protein [Salipiger abyssi]